MNVKFKMPKFGRNLNSGNLVRDMVNIHQPTENGRHMDGVRRIMQRTGMLAALVCLTMTATAQTEPVMPWSYSHHFPKLPPLRCDFDISLFSSSRHHWQLMPTESLQKTDAAATQSIMLQQRGGETTPRLKVKRLKRVMPVGDPLQGVRDEIVRKRRFEEGRPLQPLPPPYPRM
jgi:hypothetical protein